MPRKADAATQKIVGSKKKNEKVTFFAPSHLKKAFRLKATNDDSTITDVLCTLMQAYLDGKIKVNEVKNG